MSDTFTTAVLHSARRTALADGVLIDATQGDFAAVSREHFPERDLAMTNAVFALIEQGIDSEDARHFAEVWHEILWSAHVRRVCPVAGGHTFNVGVRLGEQLCWRDLKIFFHRDAYGAPCATVMLASEA